MNVIEQKPRRDIPLHISSMQASSDTIRELMSEAPEKKRMHGKLLLTGGLLGVVAAGFVLLAPELGLLTSVIGGAISGAGSAGMTLLARK